MLAAFKRAPDAWRRRDGRLAFDAVKLSHHGSKGNTSRALCDAIACPRWLVSTNGARFGHPHPEVLSRVVLAAEAAGDEPPTFVLNHVTEFVTDFIAAAGDRYRVVTPAPGAGPVAGVTVSLQD